MNSNRYYNRSVQVASGPIATINSSFDFSTNNSTHIDTVASYTNNTYTYSGTFKNQYEQGILYTVAMIGFMSLKNDDHSVTGTNAQANKRMLKDAIATRAAADALLASGAIVLLGTWSNGIQVGPGEGFARIGHDAPTQAQRDAVQASVDAEYATPAKKTRKMPAPVFGPAYVAPLAPPPGIMLADDQDALHVWRSEMDFSYVPETFADTFAAQCHESVAAIAAAPIVRKAMWLPTTDGSLVLNPEFTADVLAFNAAQATADDTDDEIDAMLDAIIEREEAA